MPTALETAAEAAYNKFNENLIGDCEPSWQETTEDFKLRLIESIEAAIKSIREPNDKQYNALCNINLGWKDLNSRIVWQTYIDAILNDK